MKITYKDNPLETIVELDETEKEILRLKTKIEILYEDAWMAEYHLKEKNFDLEKAKDYLKIFSSEKLVNEEVDRLFEEYIKELQLSHCGDCVCFPCSCTKCHAEGMLGINTFPDLGSHSAHKIAMEFRKYKTIDEVIDSLENFNPKMEDCWVGKVEVWKSHLPRWTKEAKEASVWLKNYKKEKLSEL